MAEDVVQWDELRTGEQWAGAIARGEGARRPADVYEEWLAATKIAYTQGG